MTACANSTLPLPDKLPDELTKPCEDLTPLENSDGKSVLKWAMNTVFLYKDCQARHRALIDATQAQKTQTK